MRQLVSIAGVVPDRWVDLSELADGAAATHLIVAWSDWQKAPSDWLDRAAHVGVRVPPDTSFAALQPHLDRLDLIAIAFPGVSEGRGYSLARQLRERGCYRGELRAVGEIFRDHVLFLARCGFDSFEISSRESAEGAFAALQSFTVAYQPERSDSSSIPLMRRGL
jgi:uncharacterized protein (DUF934 family)